MSGGISHPPIPDGPVCVRSSAVLSSAASVSPGDEPQPVSDSAAPEVPTPRGADQAVLAGFLPSAACAAASRAIGTRNGEHDT